MTAQVDYRGSITVHRMAGIGAIEPSDRGHLSAD